MIINPSVQTMIPRRNSFRSSSCAGHSQTLNLPGGKALWFAVLKASLVSLLFLLAVSCWATYSIEQVQSEVRLAEAVHAELVDSNIILRAQKAQLFSPKEVGKVAKRELALYFPASGQYVKF